MSENNDIIKSEKQELLDIFVTEEDIRGDDLLAMSDFFNISIDKIEDKMNLDTTWDVYNNVNPLIGKIASAFKEGYDFSEMGVLIADHSHFSKDIIEGLKSGIYHVGQSKEVSGNLRPAILDENEQLVKFFTLKKAVNPVNVLSDISALSMQISLQNISTQIREVEMKVQYQMDFQRKQALKDKFNYARGSIMLAASATNNRDRDHYLKEADKDLKEGLTNLYSDFDLQIDTLSRQDNWYTGVDTIDSLLSYISEDMQMIPKYVGMRTYLFCFRNMLDDAVRILDDYRYYIEKWSDRKIGKDGYTAFELVHENYLYNTENKDFWLKAPKQIIKAMDSYKNILEQNNKDVFYIDVEENTNE